METFSEFTLAERLDFRQVYGRIGLGAPNRLTTGVSSGRCRPKARTNAVIARASSAELTSIVSAQPDRATDLQF
jgi:hypothetical protein